MIYSRFTNEITLDWDISFKTYKNSNSYKILQDFAQKNKDNIVSIQIRKSSNKNTHIKIIFSKQLYLLEAFEIRAYLRDDPYRLTLDLVRDYMNKSINRLWDAKIRFIEQEIKMAGDWQDITKEVMEKW